MTEKRFKLAYCDYDWWAICDNENDNEYSISGQEVVDLMNELNEQSKMDDRIANDLLEAKEQLEDDSVITMLMELKKKNQELKQLNIPVDEIEGAEIDKQGRIIVIHYKR